MTDDTTNNDPNKITARRDSATRRTNSVSGPFKRTKYDSSFSIDSNDVSLSLFFLDKKFFFLQPLTKRSKNRMTEQLKFCLSIIKDLFHKKNLSFVWPFAKPVDVENLNLPDYYQIIKKPMDLGTVKVRLKAKKIQLSFIFILKKKLENREYATPDEFAADVRLIFSNCYLYNGPNTDVVAMCKKVEVKLQEKKSFFLFE
jgi:hypothetical protein